MSQDFKSLFSGATGSLSLCEVEIFTIIVKSTVSRDFSFYISFFRSHGISVTLRGGDFHSAGSGNRQLCPDCQGQQKKQQHNNNKTTTKQYQNNNKTITTNNKTTTKQQKQPNYYIYKTLPQSIE